MRSKKMSNALRRLGGALNFDRSLLCFLTVVITDLKPFLERNY